MINSIKIVCIFWNITESKSYNNIEILWEGELMRKCYKHLGNQLGVIIACVGIGVLSVVILPFWWWLIAAGGGIVYCGFYIMNHNNHC